MFNHWRKIIEQVYHPQHRLVRLQRVCTVGETTEKIYCFIRDYVGKHGKPPSYAQIAEGCGIRPGTVGAHLSYLEARGLIRRADNTRRGITLTNAKAD